MYRIDEFLKEYHRHKDIQKEIKKGVWVNARPIPFPPGIATRLYWREKLSLCKDAWFVLRGKAIAVEW